MAYTVHALLEIESYGIISLYTSRKVRCELASRQKGGGRFFNFMYQASTDFA